MAGVFFAQERESGFDEVDGTEEDYFELIANEALGGSGSRKFFYCTNNR